MVVYCETEEEWNILKTHNVSRSQNVKFGCAANALIVSVDDTIELGSGYLGNYGYKKYFEGQDKRFGKLISYKEYIQTNYKEYGYC